MTGAVILFAALTLGQVAQDSATPSSPPTPVPTPAAVVAQHVRSALSNPDENMNWAVLKASVREMESISEVPDPSVWTARLDGVRYWIAEIDEVAGSEILFGLALLGTGLLVAGLVPRWMRGRARRASSATPLMASQDISRGRAWTATVLSDQGLSDLEVARRTGMARDAVTLALKTQTPHLDPDQRIVA
jgi:hypothetical protein